jgi:hypothetical protein
MNTPRADLLSALVVRAPSTVHRLVQNPERHAFDGYWQHLHSHRWLHNAETLSQLYILLYSNSKVSKARQHSHGHRWLHNAETPIEVPYFDILLGFQ